MIRFISIVVLTFAFALILLGAVTTWLEHARRRAQGVVLGLVGLVIGAGYAFLGSRFSLAAFGRLVIQVDLPALMATALVYTAGVLGGVSLAFGLFLWATGRYRNRVGQSVIAIAAAGLIVAIVATVLAIVFGAR
ncbi:MAG: hypothetical protein GX620_02075 [Chloroflexi bacterium]|nr:hypothetical protein [Chloroflexota bacterium]